MTIKYWSSKDNWWFQEGMSFSQIWQSVVLKYGQRIAYFKQGIGVSYLDLESEAQIYREAFAGHGMIRINGLALDWLAQAIAAWTKNQLVVIYDPSWQETDPLRYELVRSYKKESDWETNPHLLLFSSGTTGQPKAIVRKAAFALCEAASYIEDILPCHFEQAICFIQPWFGAMTKHCLGMLFAGVPQHFSMPSLNARNLRTLIYGTPSLITHQALNGNYTWQALSFTGERVNAYHLAAFKKCLEPNGFVLDAYGSSECGVIARQKYAYKELDKILGPGFSGKILPGKDLSLDANGILWVSAWQGPNIATGDLAMIEADRLTLIGRQSSQRKIRGLWVDVSPLLHLLALHPDIYHFELSTKQTSVDQLIVLVAAKASLAKEDLYQWIFENLSSFQLMPFIILSHLPPNLGATGKQILLDICPKDELKSPDYVVMMMKTLLNPLSEAAFLDKSLDDLGFDSLDMTSLILALEREVDLTFPVRTLMKTDTPRQISQLLHYQPKQVLFRSLNNGPSKPKRLICLGSGIAHARQALSQYADLKYSDIIYEQKTAFSFTQLANVMIAKEKQLFLETDELYIGGYSINAILAVELAYQLERHGIAVKGVFLLDPPNLNRKSYLIKKRFFLQLRAYLIGLGPKSWEERYAYELRKIALIKQPKRTLKAPILTIYSQGLSSQNPWLESLIVERSLELNFVGHLELVNTKDGIESWKNLACEFIDP